jgi:glutathione synthase/RimK-type ligase-like ATP-grasp enzyme
VFGRGLVGVDLLPLGPGRYIVIEVNGAVDFTPQYAPLVDVYACTVEALLEREPLAATA